MRLLIVGPLDGHISAASKIALAQGAKVLHADTLDNGLAALRGGQGAELVFIDVLLDVERFMRSLESERIAIPVVACGVSADPEAAVRAIKSGAKEYVPLPPDPELIAALLTAVSNESHALLHADPSTARVLRLVDQVAASEATVLITGESGTGKEVFARHIHRKSRRADQPFVSVNCAAIPEMLLESELFGHEKGAFTGAVARRVGKFEEANGGTLLLDEISEMHPHLQAKLLRAVQEREIDRVGGNLPVKIDIRLICTSNRDLEREVRVGKFREDLYFRVNVVNMVLPPLRERPGDIPVLASHFAEKYATMNGLAKRTLTAEALAKLTAHPWPGNVRELENTLHRAVLLAQGDTLGPESIMLVGSPASPTSAARAGRPVGEAVPGGLPTQLVGRTVADVERDLIIGTLSHCLGNRTHAANILGISIRTLRNKLRQYSDAGLAVPGPAGAERAQA
jgi:two-component system, response regulator FlrC